MCSIVMVMEVNDIMVWNKAQKMEKVRDNRRQILTHIII
jgi:hypothetical protein